ncbi:coiled-coil domain-containing protein 152 isoform 2-T2 [Molossus nigricans]
MPGEPGSRGQGGLRPEEGGPFVGGPASGRTAIAVGPALAEETRAPAGTGAAAATLRPLCSELEFPLFPRAVPFPRLTASAVAGGFGPGRFCPACGARLDMSQSSNGCVKKVSSVNLDKLINDFSQIEKKMMETIGKNNILDMQLEKTNCLLKGMQTKEVSLREECATLHNMIKGLQQTIEYQHNLKVELNEEKKKELIEKMEVEISELNTKLRIQEKEKQNEIIKLQLEFDAKLARVQTKSKSYPDSTVLPQSIYRRKLQHLQEEKNKEIAILRDTIRDLEQRLSVGKDPHLKRRRF